MKKNKLDQMIEEMDSKPNPLDDFEDYEFLDHIKISKNTYTKVQVLLLNTLKLTFTKKQIEDSEYLKSKILIESETLSSLFTQLKFNEHLINTLISQINHTQAKDQNIITMYMSLQRLSLEIINNIGSQKNKIDNEFLKMGDSLREIGAIEEAKINEIEESESNIYAGTKNLLKEIIETK